jgi:hypothetical protein
VASHTADRTMQRGLHIFILSSMAAFGYVLVFITSVWAKYCGIILTGMGVYGALPIVSIQRVRGNSGYYISIERAIF